MTGWQPIETAPKEIKDGRLVYVFQGKEIYHLARWTRREYFGRGVKAAWWASGGTNKPMSVYDGSGGIELNPTHWMPLPDPPEDKP